jgi:hypothetical protein
MYSQASFRQRSGRRQILTPMKSSISSLSPARAKPAMFVTMFSVFALVVMAGCGGGGGTKSASAASSSASTSTVAPAGAASFAAYSKCMTSHGIPASALTRRGNGPPTTGGTAGTDGSTPPASTPDGPGNGPTPSLPAGVTQTQYQAALDACRSQLPAGGFGGGGGAGGGANSAEFAAYRNCLQLHGVTLPTGGQRAGGQPDATGQTAPSGSTPPAGGFGGLNTSDPTVQAALTACMSLRPAQGSPTTSTTAP